MANWDDARYVLALARSGTIRAAAKSLAVNHTTVSRRITTLEKQLSARLFELTPSGYVMTVSGKLIYKAAEEMEDLLVSAYRRIEGADSELSGEVHIHIPDIFDDWVCKQLAPFLQQHPKLKINLSSEVAVADLSRREADIALRFTDEPPLDMIGKKITELPVALYANKNFDIDTIKSVDNFPLDKYPWVRWSSQFSQTPLEQWTDKACKGTSSITRVMTYKSLTNMIRNSVGIGFLCPWFAEDDPELKRISPAIDELSMSIW
ncbi:MAG: LysR family transcriptional regulator, partial [Gammaproteobacteria bacterium]